MRQPRRIDHQLPQQRALGRGVKLRVSTHGLRSVEHNGGLDNWLMKTGDDLLSANARKVKKEVAKKLAETAA